MRLFIAVLPDAEVRDALEEVQHRMYTLGYRGSYDVRDNFHLTLAYIGEYPDVQEVMNLLQKVQQEPLNLTLSKTGVFRRLYWCGVKDSPELHVLAAEVRQRLEDAGIPFDGKEFLPHITILRKASYAGGEPAFPEVPDVSWVVQRISLMKSERGEHGMVYTEIGSYPLQIKTGC